MPEIEALLPEGAMQHCVIPETAQAAAALLPAMTTLQITGGRRNKLRPGDLLGALTGEGGVTASVVGAIDLFDNYSYVAVLNAHLKTAQQQLANRPIKGRRYRVRVIK